LAFFAPLAYPSLVHQSDVPGVIRALYARERVTVLEFFDFRCPHCQDLSPRLKALVDEDPRLELRYGYTPLPGNPGSRDAARAAICAGEQQKEREAVMALLSDRRFELDRIQKTVEGIVPDANQFAECLRSKRPDDRIAADTEALKAAGFVGLPTTYVGGIRILGAESDLIYRDAFVRVLEGRDTRGLSPPLYWLGVLLVLIALLLQGRVRKQQSASTAR
jgi:protein-disulfide isomerase